MKIQSQEAILIEDKQLENYRFSISSISESFLGHLPPQQFPE
jgi:hypothetical protein